MTSDMTILQTVLYLLLHCTTGGLAGFAFKNLRCNTTVSSKKYVIYGLSILSIFLLAGAIGEFSKYVVISDYKKWIGSLLILLFFIVGYMKK